MSKAGVLIWRKLFESGDAKRIAKQKQDTSDLILEKDIPYVEDGERGHLLDIYRLRDADTKAPVMINIHGGGLFASYKEVNAHFNYAWARRGYRVVSISYRRIPETTLWHQVDDIMAALRYLDLRRERLGLNLESCFLTGDSAGALLCLFALALHGSRQLRQEFGIEASGIRFRAAGLISIMLDTQRRDFMCAIRNVITSREDRGKAYTPYLLDPKELISKAGLPPVFQVTSAEDVIRGDSLELAKVLEEAGTEHAMLDFPKGKERRLIHVFAVSYPMYPESRKVFDAMDAFFKAHGANRRL